MVTLCVWSSWSISPWTWDVGGISRCRCSANKIGLALNLLCRRPCWNNKIGWQVLPSVQHRVGINMFEAGSYLIRQPKTLLCCETPRVRPKPIKTPPFWRILTWKTRMVNVRVATRKAGARHLQVKIWLNQRSLLTPSRPRAMLRNNDYCNCRNFSQIPYLLIFIWLLKICFWSLTIAVNLKPFLLCPCVRKVPWNHNVSDGCGCSGANFEPGVW